LKRIILLINKGWI